MYPPTPTTPPEPPHETPQEPPEGPDLARADAHTWAVLRQEHLSVHGRWPDAPTPVPAPAAESAAPPTQAQLLRALREQLHRGGRPDDHGQAPDPVCGLALSGGGIRSATYGLGVLQGLASVASRHGPPTARPQSWLERFHYLSTVSGGGYIGSWLTAWIRRQQGDVAAVAQALRNSSPDARPGGAATAPADTRQHAPAEAAALPRHPTAEADPVRRLRAYSNYLSPALGLSGDLMALVAIFSRNLVLHWLVVVPILLLVLMLPRLALALTTWLHAVPATATGDGACHCVLWALAVVAPLGIGWATAYMAADLPPVPAPGQPTAGAGAADQFMQHNLLPLALASAALALLSPTLAQWSWQWQGRLGSGRGLLLEAALYAVGFAALHSAAARAGAGWRVRRGLPPRPGTHNWIEIRRGLAVGALGGLLLWLAVHGLARLWPALPATGADLGLLLSRREWFIVAGLPAMLGVFWLTVTLFAGMYRDRKSEEDREWWARAAGFWLLLALAWAALAVAVLKLPRWLLQALAEANGPDGLGLAAGGSGLLGLAAATWGYWSSQGDKLKGAVSGLRDRLAGQMLNLLSLAFIAVLAVALGLGLSEAVGRLLPPALSALAKWPPLSTAGALPVQTDQLLQADRLALSRQRCAAAEAALAASAARPAALAAAWGASRSSPPAWRDAGLKACLAEPVRLNGASTEGAKFQARLHGVNGSALALLLALAGGLVLLARKVPRRFGVNSFSLHGMYGNRLTRAYLGASADQRSRRSHWFTGFDPSDDLPLADVPPAPAAAAGSPPAPGTRRLYPIVNTALNLVRASGGRLEWQQRKAASFFFTPHFSGSPALGFAPTADFGKPLQASPDLPDTHRVGGLRLGRAMAISGAAASPNMGYHSSLPVAFAMTFFNVRLGWWMPNPRRVPEADQDEAAMRARWQLEEPPGVLDCVRSELLLETSDNTPFVYLSDGGHFENLGLYELVRRRCHRIVVVDATCDGHFTHDDLQQSVRKIRIDFGISVEFDHGLPTAESVRRTKKPWALGTVHYADADPGAPDGQVLYLKPALWDDLPLDVLRYADASVKRPKRDKDGQASDAAWAEARAKGFPHQSTGDQFFNEDQFESYRMLGLRSVVAAFGPDGQWPRQKPDHRPPSTPPAAAATAPPPRPRPLRRRIARP